MATRLVTVVEQLWVAELWAAVKHFAQRVRRLEECAVSEFAAGRQTNDLCDGSAMGRGMPMAELQERVWRQRVWRPERRLDPHSLRAGLTLPIGYQPP